MKIIRINTFFNIGFHVCLPGLLIFINSLPLYAHDLPAEHEHELFFDMPIVLSANRLEQPASSAGASITVIDRETIIASGARTIPEVLRLVPGMQVGFSGNEFGDEPQYVVTYHGHSDQYSRQMQVLIDGRSIYEPFRGGVNWKSIPVNINDIERIEVSRGPNMATYGTNSFQAAINIITRTAAEDQGSFIQTNIDSDDIRDITYRYGGSSGNLDYRITAATLNDAGLDSANQYDYPDDTQSNNIDYRLDYQLNNNNTISYQGGYGKNHQQTDRNHSGEYPLARTVENTRIFQFVKWESVINQKNTVLLQYYYNLSDKKDSSLVDIPPPFDPFTLDGDIRTERHNFEFTHFFTPDENFRFLWGASTQLDVALAPLYLGTADKVKNNQLRGFANIEWHLDQQNIINAGALVENNDYTPTDLSPRLSLTHVFNEHHSVRIGISQAIRNPFIFEGDADTYINQELTVNTNPAGIIYTDQIYLGSIPANIDLQNEKITSYEIAYYGRFIDSNLLFNARFSHDEITNFIRAKYVDIPSTQDQSYVFMNTDDTTTNGLELELDYHIDPTLRLIASGAVINIQSDGDPNFFPVSAPQHSFSFMTIKQINEKYNGSLAYYYVDAFKWTDAPGGISEYDTLDLRLSRNFKLDWSNGSLSLVLKNMLGDYSDYQENPSTATAPKVVNSKLAYVDFRLNF